MTSLTLTLHDIHVTAPSGRILLDLPQFSLPAGQSLAIRGPSGAGKSTLLHVLAGLLPVARGQILWGDTDLACLSDAKAGDFRRRHIGQIFQDFLLFDELPALENAAVARLFAPRAERAEILDRAASALAALGLDPKDQRRAATYSGGERQRIAVARALAQNPAVLLADEPTASLDRANADRLTDDLLDAARRTGLGLICVTHDDTLAWRLGQTLTLSDGTAEAPKHAA
ncbi:ABC transporter ATP-binding protein [Puniceibacterium sp. IMCC21224]|uniref:ABC transporter ATP-binding protein n=1 Tax=Puniceibacterium sp. IMCC21224 TaxID=1618204 RepID=UPI00064DC018|nr:ATP-binding cassette domain-containing protein [Puniceibacterium sp. IMCC21224]